MSLNALGLTKNESKAYESLLRIGKAGAAQISKESQVPYGRIYGVLDSLEEKGLVKPIPEKSRKYVPSSPEALQEYIAKQKLLLEEAETKIKEYKSIYSQHIQEPIQIARGKRNFYKILRQLSFPKKYEYNIKYTFETRPESKRIVKRIIRQKKDYKVLGRIDEETTQNVDEWRKITNIKPIENQGVAIAIIDDRELMVAMIKSNTIMLVKDEPFIMLMKTLFMNYYKNS